MKLLGTSKRIRVLMPLSPLLESKRHLTKLLAPPKSSLRFKELPHLMLILVI
jgi:hypothetical protein